MPLWVPKVSLTMPCACFLRGSQKLKSSPRPWATSCTDTPELLSQSTLGHHPPSARCSGMTDTPPLLPQLLGKSLSQWWDPRCRGNSLSRWDHSKPPAESLPHFWKVYVAWGGRRYPVRAMSRCLGRWHVREAAHLSPCMLLATAQSVWILCNCL